MSKTLTFILLYIVWFLSYMDREIFNVYSSDISHSSGIDLLQLGIISGLFYCGYAIIQLPGGVLINRFGPKVVIILALLVWSLCTSVTPFVKSFYLFCVVRFLFGMTEGFFPSASVRTIYDNFEESERGKITTLLLSSGDISMIISPMIIGSFFSLYNWRLSFLWCGTIGVLISILFLLYIKSPKIGENIIEDKPIDFMAMRGKEIWVLSTIWFLVSFTNKGLDVWMPFYLRRDLGASLQITGVMVALPNFLGAVATISGGFIIQRFFINKEYRFISANIIFMSIPLFFMYFSHNIVEIIALQCLVYLFKSFVFSAIVFIPSRLFGRDGISVGFSIIAFMGYISGFMSSTVIGYIVHSYGGYSSAFLCFLFVSFLSLLLSLSAGLFYKI